MNTKTLKKSDMKGQNGVVRSKKDFFYLSPFRAYSPVRLVGRFRGRLSVLALIFMLLAGCTGGEKQDLKAKQKELSDLKSKQRDIAAKITVLEKEIAKLDTSLKVAAKAKLIGVDTLAPTTFKHFVEVEGQVDAKENVLALQLAPGVVTSVLVSVGDYVHKGQVLFTTDASATESQIATLRTQLSLATSVFEKQDRLWKENIGSEVQYLQAKTNKEAAESQLAQLKNAVELTKCKSPIDGVVDEIRVKIGDMAAPSQAMPGVRVVNNSSLVIKAKLSDAQIGLLEVGDVVKVFFPDINTTIESKVSFVGQVVDKQSRTFNVEVKLDNRNANYKSNMIARLQINDDVQKNVITVPTNTIQQNDKGENYVLVVENHIAVKKVVVVGSEYNGTSVIKKGLNKGDKLISFGYSEVVDGQNVSY
jgi:membrane fusion protein (multidrug efflux system)